MNLYTYVENNPLTYIDPTGMSAEDATYDQNQHDYLEKLSKGNDGNAEWAKAELKANKCYVDKEGKTYSDKEVSSARSSSDISGTNTSTFRMPYIDKIGDAASVSGNGQITRNPSTGGVAPNLSTGAEGGAGTSGLMQFEYGTVECKILSGAATVSLNPKDGIGGQLVGYVGKISFISKPIIDTRYGKLCVTGDLTALSAGGELKFGAKNKLGGHAIVGAAVGVEFK